MGDEAGQGGTGHPWLSGLVLSVYVEDGWEPLIFLSHVLMLLKVLALPMISRRLGSFLRAKKGQGKRKITVTRLFTQRVTQGSPFVDFSESYSLLIHEREAKRKDKMRGSFEDRNAFPRLGVCRGRRIGPQSRNMTDFSQVLKLWPPFQQLRAKT